MSDVERKDEDQPTSDTSADHSASSDVEGDAAPRSSDAAELDGATPEVREANAAATSASEGGSAGASRWIGYVGGLAIIGASAASVFAGQPNMFERMGAEPVAVQQADGGPCAQWEQQVCAGVGGEKAYACNQVKAAAGLLSDQACQAQLRDVAGTLAKVEAGRADCRTLMDKLCTDLGAETAGCGIVKERTPSFPGERCGEMLGKYDKVLGELQQLSARSATSPGGGRPPGMPAHAGHAHGGGAASPKPAVVPASASAADTARAVPASVEVVSPK